MILGALDQAIQSPSQSALPSTSDLALRGIYPSQSPLSGQLLVQQFGEFWAFILMLFLDLQGSFVVGPRIPTSCSREVGPKATGIIGGRAPRAPKI